MEKELNVPEINNVFNDEIAAQIKEIESRLEKEEVKPVENKTEEVKPVINTETKENAKPEIREPKIMPQVEVKEEAKQETKGNDFDNMFSSLYNDVAGANNFISNLIEQKKKVNLNEASLNEDREKLEADKKDFEKYCETQKELIKQEKERLEAKRK